MLLAPEILVAAASEISTSPDVPRRNTAFEPHRLETFVDALATVCVQRGEGEGYAVTLQLHASRGVSLFIAGNEGVPESVQRHLYRIWSVLSTIASQSVEFHKLLGEFSDSSEPPPYTAALIEDRIAMEVHKLRNILYSHSLKKVASRIAKRFREFVRFVGKLETHYHQRPWITDVRELRALTCLRTVSQYIRTTHSMLLEPGSVDITVLATSMCWIHRAVRMVLKAPESLTKWSSMSLYGLFFNLCSIHYSCAHSTV